MAAKEIIVLRGAWSEVLSWLEFVLKHPACPDDLAAAVDGVMKYCRLAYGVFDGVVICAIGSDAEIPMARVPMTHAQDDISHGGAGSG